MTSFDKISELITELHEEMISLSNESMEKLVKAINTHCVDTHFKVSQSALGTLARLLSLFPDEVEKYLFSFIITVNSVSNLVT